MVASSIITFVVSLNLWDSLRLFMVTLVMIRKRIDMTNWHEITLSKLRWLEWLLIQTKSLLNSISIWHEGNRFPHIRTCYTSNMYIQCTIKYVVTEHKDLSPSEELAVTEHKDMPSPSELAVTKNTDMPSPVELVVTENKNLHSLAERQLVSKLGCFLNINTYGVTLSAN
ncbi:hypothetical protein ACE6H2_023664 [Prunus campanulata]